ncbi:MAG TPA: hypothetical protein VFR51_06910 [Pyrinomonadaceae bacterium]|nr:hypothetical protein [Pyrinomonadaceae bacterium]
MQNPPPVQTSSQPPAQMAKSSTGLDENLAALLAYVAHFASGLIFFLIEKNSRLVRFHAMQAIILGGLFFVGGFILGIAWAIIGAILSQISGLLASLVGLVLVLVIFVFMAAVFVGWILCMVKAYQGQYFKLPVIGNFAEKFSQQ